MHLVDLPSYSYGEVIKSTITCGDSLALEINVTCDKRERGNWTGNKKRRPRQQRRSHNTNSHNQMSLLRGNNVIRNVHHVHKDLASTVGESFDIGNRDDNSGFVP